MNDTFRHNWSAEILASRPMILPSRRYVYPNAAEEVERGALEVLIQPGSDGDEARRDPFLATFALGFRDPSAPTGIWSMPNPDWMCALSGGYAYCVDVMHPERFVFVRYKPVLQVLSYRSQSETASEAISETIRDGLILFAGHYSILAWGSEGEAWESDRLSWEGLTDLRIDREAAGEGVRDVLRGAGWDLIQDREIPFTLDMTTGLRL